MTVRSKQEIKKAKYKTFLFISSFTLMLLMFLETNVNNVDNLVHKYLLLHI